MKVLHLLKSGHNEAAGKIIEMHKTGNEVKVIDLTEGNISYGSLVEDIFSYDKVISW